MTLAVVVTYRNPEDLKKCLATIDRPVFVRDNSDDNILYTAAINEGILRALAEGKKYVLVCCDDVLVRPGAISAMEDFLEKTSDAAIAMPIQLDSAGKVTCGGCTQAFPYGRHINEPMGHELYREPYESFWANGACFLLRTDAVRECGLLDTNMKFICSDSDYSFTLRARGWKIFVVPSAHVVHEPRGALATASAFLEKQKDKDSLYFIKKWLTGGIFQELSFEGSKLKVQDIINQITILQGRIEYGYEPCDPKDSGRSDAISQ